MTQQIPVILCDTSTAPAFSLFNPNDWDGKSKLVIQSCAAHYGLLIHTEKKIKDIVNNAETLCAPRFGDLTRQWKTSKWDISKCTYWVDIPEVHLSIHSFLSTVKTFLDIIVQLISSEGIVAGVIHGFHEKGDKVLKTLKNNVSKSNEKKATLLYNFIAQQKDIWIDKAIYIRDFFIHPEKGLSTVMFSLDVREEDGELQLTNIQKPSFDDEEFNVYAENALIQAKEFSEEYIKLIKSV
jgi:hypothetical protein